MNRGTLAAWAVGWALVIASPAAPLAADDLDSVFDAPTADVETPPAAPVVSAPQPVRAFGTLSAYGVGATDASVQTLYGVAAATVGLDIRPDKALRILGSLVTNLPDTTDSSSTKAKFSMPAISELFVDYVVGDWAVFRVGQFALTWGQARLVTNVGNLVSTVYTGESAKVALPVGSGTLNLLASGQGTLDANKVPATLLAGGNFDQTFGPFTLGVAAIHQKTGVLQTSASVRTAWGGADWYVEGVATFNPDWSPYEADAVAGFLWQGGIPTVTVGGEYLLKKVKDSVSNDQHTTALGLTYDGKQAWGITPKVQWFHAWDDGSGEVLPVLVSAPASLPDVTLTLGVPVVYGNPGTRYVVANDDPAQRRWALGLKVAVDYSF